MKILLQIFWIGIVSAIKADLQTSETQATGRNIQSSKPTAVNTIPLTQKAVEQYYQHQIQQPRSQHTLLQQSQQPLQQYYPVQYVSSPIYQQPHSHPQPAMIIIAQQPPPQTMLTHAAHQLLAFLNANPQAKYQFLQGNFQPQVQPQAYVPQASPTPSYTYQLMAVQPQYQHVQASQSNAPFVASPQVAPLSIAAQLPPQTHQSNQPQQQTQHVQQQPAQSVAQQTYNQLPQFHLPIIGPFGHSTHIPHIAALAQLSTQKYIPPNPYRSPGPAIITGLENFTAEQQAQIKAQLQSGGPITPLRSNLPPNIASAIQQNASTKSNSAAISTSPQEFPAQEDDKNSNQQTNVQSLNSDAYNSRSGYDDEYTKG